MKKVTIEIEIPDELDILHAMTSVVDACWWSDNVTQQEHDLVNRILYRISEQLKHETLTN
jgi:hypothetical protein